MPTKTYYADGSPRYIEVYAAETLAPDYMTVVFTKADNDGYSPCHTMRDDFRFHQAGEVPTGTGSRYGKCIQFHDMPLECRRLIYAKYRTLWGDKTSANTTSSTPAKVKRDMVQFAMREEGTDWYYNLSRDLAFPAGCTLALALPQNCCTFRYTDVVYGHDMDKISNKARRIAECPHVQHALIYDTQKQCVHAVGKSATIHVIGSDIVEVSNAKLV